jgi:hypothetical protein
MTEKKKNEFEKLSKAKKDELLQKDELRIKKLKKYRLRQKILKVFIYNLFVYFLN